MISRIDHFILPVADLEASLSLYEGILDFHRKMEHGRPAALLFGQQKINVHQSDKTFEPKAIRPTPGAADLCLITELSMADVIGRLNGEGVVIEIGPIERVGAQGKIMSVYLRDPHGNLIEIAKYWGDVTPANGSRGHFQLPPEEEFRCGCSVVAGSQSDHTNVPLKL